jgi:putative transposase
VTMINVAYKFRIYPNAVQDEILSKTFGCCRFLWNQMLNERNDTYQRLKDDKELPHSHEYKTEKQYKQEFPFLKEVDAKALQNVNRNLFQAFQNFFDGMKGKRPRVGYPSFKSKHSKQSYTTNNINDNIKIDFEKKRIKLPKIDAWFKYRDDRTFIEKIRKVTISKTKSGKYFASISFEREKNVKQMQEIDEGKITALDMSFASFIVSENGRMDNPRFYRKNEQKLKRLHRQVSRKRKGSSNRNKACVTLARFYDWISNARTDWQHKISRELVNANDVIILEDLNVEGMKRFNSGFAKTVTLDFSWSEFVRMIAYKAERDGKYLVLVDRFYPSSKTCSACGFVNDDLTLSDRVWTCPSCHVIHDRDTNSTKNLKREGKQILFEGMNVKINTTATAGTAGSHVSGDRARPVNPMATVNERRIHTL